MKQKFLLWLDRYVLGEPVRPHEPDAIDDIDDLTQDVNCELLCWLLALLGAIALAAGLMR